jgi:hypothetical protein
MSLNFPVGKLDIVPWKPTALAMLLLVVLCGCAYPGVSYGGAVAVDFEDGYPGDYFEPYGFEYGGWGGGYRVGPPRHGGRRLERPGRPYHAPPPSRPMPSIPSRPRGRR